MYHLANFFNLILMLMIFNRPVEFAAVNTRGRVFRMKSFVTCANETLEISNLKLAAETVSADKFLLNGELTILERVPGPLDFTMELLRCDSSQKKCDRYPAMKIPQMCQRFKDKNAFYTKTLESISPRFICPLSPGNFIFKEAAVDLEYLAKFRLDGYTWKCRMMLVSAKEATTIACVDIDVAIMRGSNKN